MSLGKKNDALIKLHNFKPKFMFVRVPEHASMKLGRDEGAPLATVCVLQENDGGLPLLRMGIAMIHPKDKEFNKTRGKTIAFGKAYHCFQVNGKARKSNFIRGTPMFLFAPGPGKLVLNIVSESRVRGARVGFTPHEGKRVTKKFWDRWCYVRGQALAFYDRTFEWLHRPVEKE